MDYKKKCLIFLKTEDGQKVLLYIGIGILIAVLWKVVLIVAIIVGAVYLIKKKRGTEDDKHKHKHSK